MSGVAMVLQETLPSHSGALACFESPRIKDDKGSFGPPELPPFTEEGTLIDGLRNGDEQAFETLVMKFGPRLLAKARRYLRSEDDACDVLQDGFLCAFKSIGNFKGDSHSQLSTWLHRIIINCAFMHLRTKKRRSEIADVEIDELLPRFDPAGNWMDGDSRSMSQVYLEIFETKVTVRRCIEHLPDAYRLVLTLRDIDELDTEEVASLLGVTGNNVKVRLHRARQALKALIEREQTL
jgi:RNA polymerase sigma-70 factor, ECF subfamily